MHSWFMAPDTALAWFRISISCVALFNAWSLWRERNTWLTDVGVLPPYAFRHVARRMSLFRLLSPCTRNVERVLLCHVAALALLLVGATTGLAAFCAWLTLVSLHARNPHILYGGDALLRNLLAVLFLSGSGASLSVDAMFADPADRPGTLEQAALGLFILKGHYAAVYFHAGIAKLRNSSWRNGTALTLSLLQEGIARTAVPVAWVRGWRGSVACWSTIFAEIIASVILLSQPGMQTTGVLVAVLILFHIAIETLLAVQYFSWIMIAGVPLFLGWGDLASVFEPSVTTVLAGISILHAWLWPVLGGHAPEFVRRIVRWAWLDQRWNMFCLTPPARVRQRVVLRLFARSVDGAPRSDVRTFEWLGAESATWWARARAHRYTKYSIALLRNQCRSLHLGAAHYLALNARVPLSAVDSLIVIGEYWGVARPNETPVRLRPSIRAARFSSAEHEVLGEVLQRLLDAHDERFPKLTVSLLHTAIQSRIPCGELIALLLQYHQRVCPDAEVLAQEFPWLRDGRGVVARNAAPADVARLSELVIPAESLG